VAFELIRRGISCQIIDALPGPSDKSRALAIHARTLEIFEQMGLIDNFLSMGWKSYGFTVYDRAQELVRMTFDELDCSYPYVLSIPQWHTERIFGDAVRARGNNIQWNTSLISFTQKTDRVEAMVRRTADGNSSAESETQITCRWLIGCDGAHSTVRNKLNIAFPGFPYWEQYVLADVGFETTLDTSDHYLFSGKDGVAGFHPFAQGSARVFADLGKIRRPLNVTDDLPEDRAQVSEPTQEQLQNILDDRGPGTVRLTNINWLSMHTIYRRQVQSYRHGRILLGGDAAHLHSPASGQGMNLGIQDAYNLAWKLALVEKKLAPETLLDSYSDERRLIGRRVSTMSDLFSRINELRNPIAQMLRIKVGPILAARSDVQERYRNAVAGLSSNYRLSPVVAEYVRKDSLAGNDKSQDGSPISWNTAPASGDRAPDAVIVDMDNGGAIRLFDLLKSLEYHLLLFVGQVPKRSSVQILIDLADLVIMHYGDFVEPHLFLENSDCLSGLRCNSKKYRDVHLSLHRKYGARSACLFLIRPDGYIAFRSLPPDKQALTSYLQSVFV
jgi:2-polyprenyl-6-methoxyphenol hydroxylase-like FAD-dependent oxidoreductase